jgi:hypothetical protein
MSEPFGSFEQLDHSSDAKTFDRVPPHTLFVYVVILLVLIGALLAVELYKYFHHSFSFFDTLPLIVNVIFACRYVPMLYRRLRSR